MEEQKKVKISMKKIKRHKIIKKIKKSKRNRKSNQVIMGN